MKGLIDLRLLEGGIEKDLSVPSWAFITGEGVAVAAGRVLMKANIHRIVPHFAQRVERSLDSREESTIVSIINIRSAHFELDYGHQDWIFGR